MKKIMLLMSLVFAIALAGCGLQPGRHYKPDGPKPRPLYKNLDHVSFSLWGYKNVTEEDLAQSYQEAWWGEEVPYIPAK